MWVLERSKIWSTQLQRDSTFGQRLAESLDSGLGDAGSGEVDTDESLEGVEVLEAGVGDFGVAEFQALAGCVVFEIQQCDVGDLGMAEIEPLEGR